MVNNSLRSAANKSLQTLSPLNEKESICVLNAILSGYEFKENLDAIQQTTFYRTSLKNKLNLLMPELEKATESIADVIGIDNEALLNLMVHKKELIKKISVMRPEHQSGVNALLEEYFRAPELILHRLGIKVIDRDK